MLIEQCRGAYQKLATLSVVALAVAACASTTVQTNAESATETKTATTTAQAEATPTTEQAEAGYSSDVRPEQCSNAAGIAEVLASGLPDFDYDPASDIAELVEQSEVVVTGVLDSAVRITSDNTEVSLGSDSLTEFRIREYFILGDEADEYFDSFETNRSFHIGSQWSGSEVDPLAEPVLFDAERTRFMAFLNPTGDPSTPWTFGPQGLHIWCTFDAEVQSVIDAVPLGVTVDPDTFEREVGDAVDPPPVFDFVDVPSRVLADDIASGDPWSSRLVEGIDDLDPALADLDITVENDEVLFEFVMPDGGTCARPFEALRFDQNSRVLVPQFEASDPEDDCTTAEAARLLLVAVALEDLPEGDFAIATSTGLPQGLDPVAISAAELVNDE